MTQWMSSWLAKCAADTGYPVTVVPGWERRGHGPMDSPLGGVVLHHTATAASAYAHSDYPSLGIVRDGRAGLSGPLCNLGLGRSGRIYVVAAGCAYHAGAGSWRGFRRNAQMIGIEAESNGLGRGDWTAAQLDAYPRLCASILDWLNHEGETWRVCAHREWAPGRKVDPTGIGMDAFRNQVAGLLSRGYRKGGAAASKPAATPMANRKMYDSVTAAHIPAGAQMVAGYVNGTYKWSARDWGRFPNAVHVRIATRANVNDGHVLDVEDRNATPEQAPGWVQMRRRAGVDPTVYTLEVGWWDRVRAAFRKAGVREPHYWIARYNSVATLYDGRAVAKQYLWDGHPAHSGGHYDISVVAPYWPGVDGPGATPGTGSASPMTSMAAMERWLGS